MSATPPAPNRSYCRTAKVGRERTGLRGSIHVHVDFAPDGRVTGIRLTEPSRDGSTLDRILHAVGDELTEIIVAELAEFADAVARRGDSVK